MIGNSSTGFRAVWFCLFECGPEIHCVAEVDPQACWDKSVYHHTQLKGVLLSFFNVNISKGNVMLGVSMSKFVLGE